MEAGEDRLGGVENTFEKRDVGVFALASNIISNRMLIEVGVRDETHR